MKCDSSTDPTLLTHRGPKIGLVINRVVPHGVKSLLRHKKPLGAWSVGARPAGTETEGPRDEGARREEEEGEADATFAQTGQGRNVASLFIFNINIIFIIIMGFYCSAAEKITDICVKRERP